MLPFLSKEVNYETKSGAYLCTCFTDLLCGGCWLHLGKIYLVGVTPAASLFPNKLQFHQLGNTAVTRCSRILSSRTSSLRGKMTKTSPWLLIQPFLQENWKRLSRKV